MKQIIPVFTIQAQKWTHTHTHTHMSY